MILTTVYTCEDQEPKTISYMCHVYNVCRRESTSFVVDSLLEV
jgi:hypothetical protein